MMNATENDKTYLMPLPILYQDDHLIIVNKPAGLLVHPSWLDAHETTSAWQEVSEQMGGRPVYPVHRLDKATSGLLVFAFAAETVAQLAAYWSSEQVQKEYLAVVRGYGPEKQRLEHALKPMVDDKRRRQHYLNKAPQSAITEMQCLARCEWPVSVDPKYASARYSLMLLRPLTGRKHQLRRHMKHVAHPIIGDPKHGKGIHNRYFREHWGVARLLLASVRLRIPLPWQEGETLVVDAPLDADFTHILTCFGWQQAIAKTWLPQDTSSITN